MEVLWWNRLRKPINLIYLHFFCANPFIAHQISATVEPNGADFGSAKTIEQLHIERATGINQMPCVQGSRLTFRLCANKQRNGTRKKYLCFILQHFARWGFFSLFSLPSSEFTTSDRIARIHEITKIFFRQFITAYVRTICSRLARYIIDLVCCVNCTRDKHNRPSV